MANIFSSLCMTIGGIVIAFIIGWKFAFVCLGIIPFLFLGMFVMAIGGKAKGKSINYNKAASYAEQALNLIRIVIAFGQESLEESSFYKLLVKSKQEQTLNSLKTAFGYGFFQFIMFGCYTYGLALGGVFCHKQFKKDNGEVYAAGDVISVFFGIIFGVFSIGMAAPNIKGVNDGRAALFQILKVITRRPSIIQDDPTTTNFNPNHGGDIEFRNVTFQYPSSETLALKGINLTIQANKMTALVGASGSGKSTAVKLLE